MKKQRQTDTHTHTRERERGRDQYLGGHEATEAEARTKLQHVLPMQPIRVMLNI